MKDNGIFDAPTLTFVMGHEAGHALSKNLRSQDPKYRHQDLSEEYFADERAE